MTATLTLEKFRQRDLKIDMLTLDLVRARNDRLKLTFLQPLANPSAPQATPHKISRTSSPNTTPVSPSFARIPSGDQDESGVLHGGNGVVHAGDDPNAHPHSAQSLTPSLQWRGVCIEKETQSH